MSSGVHARRSNSHVVKRYITASKYTLTYKELLEPRRVLLAL
jgi:hypothetical protein